ncbi:glycosyl hydrolase [Asanoa siamensis]|uniref:Glycosyl hydrolase n=1 Tax=Asanoa siamensis TaxID=926357 RepID=A0ABQ4CU05_9ACTN|nr:discoidin domain-containing protein [Asanoa siamensis]GIF74755.1 glycosyl hydrolase [Asanoa siamensis]
MKRRLSRRLIAATISSLLVGTALAAVSGSPAAAAGGPNLAAGKPTSASSTNGGFVAGNLTDGNKGSYWESSGALPQWGQVDLGSTISIDQVVLKLPDGWGQRTQTLSIQGSTNGSSFAAITSSAGQTFSPGNNNTVTVNFGATNARYVRVNVTANTGWGAAQISELEVYGATTSSTNLALGKATSESGHSDVYGSGNAVDGNQGTYWESTNNSFPEHLQVDLGTAVAVNRVVLKLPTSGWGARTQTLSVQGSTNGTSFSDLSPSAGRVFDPANGNTVSITFNQATTRYVRLNITANTAWPAGQISEFEVYGPTTGDTQAPTAPSGLAFTQPASGQIRLTWNASTDNVGVTGYDIYANGQLRTSVGNVLTYTDTQPTSATVSYYVRAKDLAGNQSGNSNTVTRQGTSTDTQAPSAPAGLAYTEPGSNQIRLTWNASTDNVGVTGYDVYANGAVRASVAGNVLTYTDTQPATATVSYYVRAKDAAGNVSGNSNSVTRAGSGGPGGTNLAVGKPITGSSTVHTFVAANANDDNATTYWEGAPGAYPSTLTVSLGANATVSSVVVKLPPDGAWGPRTQTFSVSGREQSASTFTTLVGSATYSFSNSSGGNTMTIPVSASVADVRLTFTANSGSSNGQVSEFQVIGTPAPNPDLTVSAISASPASPIETDSITLSATVRNIGNAGAGATTVGLYLGTTKVATANVGALAAGAQTTVTANIGARDAGTYQLVAKVDESNTVIEQSDANNTFTGGNLVVGQVQSSDLVAGSVSWSPNNPSAGQTVTFSVAIRNQGTIASAGGAHGITLTVLNESGSVVRTLTGSYSGAIAAGATAPAVSLGTWVAANGRYTVRVVLADDANELPVKRANNTSDRPFFSGRGANMPYDMYEAEDGTIGGGAQSLAPNRIIGDLAGEASGRRAVRLPSNGSWVQWTTRNPTNTLVVRFSIPDAAGGGGQSSSLNIYVNGSLHKAIPLNSRYAWLYGAEASPNNSPGSGGPRHIYDEANIMLNSSIPAGATIRLQKDSGTEATVDFVNLEQVSPRANPDPARYKVPAGTSQQEVQAAFDAARQDANSLGVYLPAGTYETQNKFQIYLRPIKVVGAGMWYTRFQTPQTGSNTNAGFDVQSSASGTSFEDLAFFGNYTSPRGRAGQGLGRVARRRQHDDRPGLGRAHRLRLLGRERERSEDHQQPLPQHVRRRGQHDQRQHEQPDLQQRGPGQRRRRVRAVLRDRLRWRGQHGERLREPVGDGDVAGGRCGGVRRAQQHVPQPLHRRPAHLLWPDDQLAGLRVRLRRVRAATDDVRQHLAHPVRWALLGCADLPGDLDVLRVQGVPGYPGVECGHRRSDVLRDHVPDQVHRFHAGEPGAGHGLHEHLDLGCAEER